MRSVFLAAVLLAWVEVSLAASGCGGQEQFNCMVATINGEARGESYEGMLIVGKSLKTRELRGYVGKSICGIAAQSYAPKPMSSRLPKKVKAKILKAAAASCASRDAGYTHFHSLRKKNATRWARNTRQFKFIGKVGKHWLFNGSKEVKADGSQYINDHIQFASYSDNNSGNSRLLDKWDIINDQDYLLDVKDEEILEIYTEEDEFETEQLLMSYRSWQEEV